MNVPAVADGNWSYRLSPRYKTAALVQKIKDMNIRTGRQA